MMDQNEMDIEYDGAYSFTIEIQDNMESSFFVDWENQKIKFKNGIVVDQNGINQSSAHDKTICKVKIDPKNIKELKIIGKGAAGLVREAVYELNGKNYFFAIKQIDATNEENRKQFLNSLRQYLSGYPSEYTIEFYTCYFNNGLVKLVIQYMDLGDLKHLISHIQLKRIVLSEEQVATIIWKILQGLDYIHNSKHTIHRDLKPENILFNSRGEVKLTDFGLSKCIEDSIGRSIKGTAFYMSPEVINEACYQYQCDIWSFGLIMYELATGLPLPYLKPGQKFNFFKVSQRIANEPPPELPADRFPPKMCDFLKRCLQKDVKKRALTKQLLEHAWIKEKACKVNLKDLAQKIINLH